VLTRFVSSVAFGLLWAVAGSATAVLVFAAALTAGIPLAWWLLRGIDATAPVEAAARPADDVRSADDAPAADDTASADDAPATGGAAPPQGSGS
jgi:hypothetical protein